MKIAHNRYLCIQTSFSMQLPESFLKRTKEILQNDFSDFLSALNMPLPISIRVNDKLSLIPSDEKVPWCNSGYYLKERPLFTADPLFHAGAYYVQEASSMFLQQALEQYVSKDSTVLDLSAAPGGKSTLISHFLNEDGFLVSNEIIRSRAYILAENMIKWGNDNVLVSNNAPKDFRKLPSFFDVVVVDAPCSGEGMFRKDTGAIDEWSEQNVMMCAARQKDILSDVWDALKKDGILIYSTCTYNQEENEENIQWIENELGAEFLPLNIDLFPEVSASGKGYRFYPHKTKGEGFFIAVLRKTSEAPVPGKNKQKKQSVKIEPTVSALRNQLLDSEKWEILQDNNIISAVRKTYLEKVEILKKELRTIHLGVTLAEQKGKDFIPHISLALSKHINLERVNSVEIGEKDAILYLQKESIYLSDSEKGFVLLKYKNVPIGWVKNLGNRTNNLYPNEWRIRMKIEVSS